MTAQQNSWLLLLIQKSEELWELCQQTKPGPTKCSLNFRAPLQNRNSTWKEQPCTSQRVRNEMPPHNVQSSARSMMHLAIQQDDLQPSPDTYHTEILGSPDFAVSLRMARIQAWSLVRNKSDKSNLVVCRTSKICSQEQRVIIQLGATDQRMSFWSLPHIWLQFSLAFIQSCGKKT